jgi:hypothetical protein
MPNILWALKIHDPNYIDGNTIDQGKKSSQKK